MRLASCPDTKPGPPEPHFPTHPVTRAEERSPSVYECERKEAGAHSGQLMQ